MAALIPALASCTGRMTAGERRLADRLQQKLDDDCLLWWDVPVGPKQTRPDFVLIHPRHGALILETKDWRLDTIQRATREIFEILAEGRTKVVLSPLQQARHCAIQVVNALEHDQQLVNSSGPHQGKLTFPWGHGVVFTRITRRQFEAAGLGASIPGHLAICQDEMLEDEDPDIFRQRLWNMFPHAFHCAITSTQLDRIRWVIFPEVRVPEQQGLFSNGTASGTDDHLPDLMRVMDLQQEQLARSMGDGHRIIHGVAGSGKTMVLVYRAEHLARTQAGDNKPILVLCYNEPLAVKLAASIQAKGLQDRVHCMHWDKWTRTQLVAHNLLPAGCNHWPPSRAMPEFVRRVIQGVDDKQIPSGQYHAILIDEGHDFAPEWLKLVTQMVDPATNSLLLLYDDAQSIYERGLKHKLSLKSLGFQAQGRTTILKINYRNTLQILQCAHRLAGGMLEAEDAGDDDAIPLLQPLSCGRQGPEPIVVESLGLSARASRIASLLADQHSQGYAWGEMAVICRHYEEMDAVADALARLGLPHRVRKKSGQFSPAQDAIQVISMHASKGLEWPVVAVVGSLVEHQNPEDTEREARLIYVAATRGTQRLIVAMERAE